TWICRYSCMEQLVTDRGTEFCNKLSAELYKLLHISKLRTASYHPQCNTSAESFNREIIKYLTAILEDSSTLDFEQYLPVLMLSYNTAIHRTSLHSPFMLTFMHEPNLPFFDLQTPQVYYSDDWATSAFIRLKRTFQLVRQNSQFASERV